MLARARALHNRSRLRAGLSSFRATDLSRSRVQAWGGSGDAHADDRARSVLRDLSRDLERNAEAYHILLHGAARLMGAPTPRILVGDQAWRAQVLSAWRDRAGRTRGGFDQRGLTTWAGLCGQWWRCFWRDGDVAILPLTTGTIATIEADCIDGGKSINQHRRVVGGIELDDQGVARAIYLCGRTTAGTPDTVRAKRYDADLVSLLAHRWSPSNTRGLPLVAAGLDNQERIDALVEAEVISSEQASNLFGALERTAGTAQLAPEVPLSTDTTSPAAAYASDTGAPSLQEFTAGSYWDLPANMSWKPHQITRPNLDVVEMLRQIARQTCAYLGIPFSVLFADFQGVTWSGNRGLVSLTRDALAWWRTAHAEPALSPIWRWWITGEISAGRIPWPTVDGQRATLESFTACAWDWPDLEWPDPSKEAQTLDLALAQGSTSLHRSVGPDWRAILDERAIEQTEADARFIARCQQAQALVATSQVPGLTWREVVNRDQSPNTVTTIPLQQQAADDQETPPIPPTKGTP